MVLKLRGPGHSLLTFQGNNSNATNSSHIGDDCMTSEEWGSTLEREIGRLRREAAPSRVVAQQRKPSALNLWSAFSSRIGRSGNSGGDSSGGGRYGAGDRLASRVVVRTNIYRGF